MTIVTLTSGTAFLMWLGEQITERGIGNGISLIIFAGIVAALPSALITTAQFVREGQLDILPLVFLLALMVVVIAAIIFIERGQRRIPVNYAKRQVGRRMYGGQSSHLPLKVNTAGVIPPIFASSLLVFPTTITQFVDHPYARAASSFLAPGTWAYTLMFVGLIIFFCYFYTAVTFNTSDVAENMKKFGGFIPGIRPGQRTADYIDRVLSRITLGGAIYVAAVCVLPTILIGYFNVPFFFGGTALLIVVGVALDTVAQIETHLLTRSYQGFMRKGRVRGRRG
jgi:preprotein translocase subunit SecY